MLKEETRVTNESKDTNDNFLTPGISNGEHDLKTVLMVENVHSKVWRKNRLFGK